MEILGLNNRVIISKDGVEIEATDRDIISRLNIKIIGNDNLVKLHYPIKALNSLILVESNSCSVEIGTTEVFFMSVLKFAMDLVKGYQLEPGQP